MLKLHEKAYILRKRLGLSRSQMAAKFGIIYYTFFEQGVIEKIESGSEAEITKAFDLEVIKEPVTRKEKFSVVRRRLGKNKCRRICSDTLFQNLSYGLSWEKHLDTVIRLEQESGMKL